MAKFCAQCGTELSEANKFCPGCGRALNQNVPPVKPRPPKIEVVNGGNSGKTKKSPLCLITCLSLPIFIISGIFLAIYYWPNEPYKPDKPSTPKVVRTANKTASKSIGDLKSGGLLTVESGTFPEGSKVSVTPCTERNLPIYNPDKYNLIGPPLRLECDKYDGTFFSTKVTLKVPLSKKENLSTEELAKYVLVYFDDKGESRYLQPDRFHISEGTMEVELPHFSLFGPAKLTR